MSLVEIVEELMKHPATPLVGLYTFNHLVVTIARAYEKYRYSVERSSNFMGCVKKRILRKGTFIAAGSLTAGAVGLIHYVDHL